MAEEFEELDGCGHNVVVRNGKEGWLRVHRNVMYEFARCLVIFPRPLIVCDTPPLGVLKNVLTKARSWLLAKDSSSFPLSLRVSQPCRNRQFCYPCFLPVLSPSSPCGRWHPLTRTPVRL